MTKKEKLAKWFNEDKTRFRYWRGRWAKAHNKEVGWHYTPTRLGPSYFVGKSLYDIQTSTFWAMKKLPGRDTF